MQKEILQQTKIGYNIARAGILSKLHAIQTMSAHSCQITPEQYTVLEVLVNHGAVYQRQISALTMKDRGNVTRILNILENLGCITKQADANGRKIYKIYLTEKGKKIYEETKPVILQTWENCITGLSEEELLLCSKLLDKVTENLKAKVNIQI